VRACEDLVYSVPNINLVHPPTPGEPGPAEEVETQSLLGPDMPIPPEYNSSAACGISSYMAFATRNTCSYMKSHFFTFANTDTTRTLVHPPQVMYQQKTDGRFLNRRNYLVSLFYGNRSELVVKEPEKFFIYDRYGEEVPKRGLVPYLSNLKFGYTYNYNSANRIDTHGVAANFQGYYQWFGIDIVDSNRAWYDLVINPAKLRI
jgi:hypothetical protein